MVYEGNAIPLQEHLERWGMRVCPIDNSLKVLGQKYALHIIRNMILLKQNKFGQFLKSIEGINTKTLAIRLQELEEFGLIKRTIIPSRPVHTEYSLTDKGTALEGVLAEIASFSTRYESRIVFKDEKPRMDMKQLFGTERLSEVYD
ncbi:MAG TPA: helix-turn-helix domain-containing protein [Nitrososphaera sp.]|jgi:DNA-binding HxlR family transcriptional regulator